MKYTMKAFVKNNLDENETRIPEWDYFFDAIDYGEACEIGYNYSQTFNQHDADGVKWLTGPYKTHNNKITPTYWMVFEDNYSNHDPRIPNRDTAASGWWEINLERLQPLSASHYDFWRMALCTTPIHPDVAFDIMQQALQPESDPRT